MGPVLRAARGFVLPLALLSTVLSGILVTGAFYLAAPSTAPAARAALPAQAHQVAEFGLRSITASGSGAPAAVPQGPVTVYTTATGSTAATYTIHVRPLSDSTALVRSEGRVVAESAEVVRAAEAVVPRSMIATE